MENNLDYLRVSKNIKRLDLDTTEPRLIEVCFKPPKSKVIETRHLVISKKGKICLV